jgi:hypothetical protein
MNKEFTSKEASKLIKQEIYPFLKELGFDRYVGRRAYKYYDDFILGFSTNAVGSYFSDVTGFPPASISATAWVYYNFVPASHETQDPDVKKLRPKTCHAHLSLNVSDMATQSMRKCDNPANTSRSDLWWVESNGENITEVLIDLKASIHEQAIDWWDTYSDHRKSFEYIEKNERDCPSKYGLLYYLATRIGCSDLATKYKELLNSEEQTYYPVMICV